MIKDIKEFGLIRTIKFAYQRIVKGYDDRFFWGMDGYFEDYFLEPIKQFCREQLRERAFMKLNPERKKIYTEILMKIKKIEDPKREDWFKQPNASSDFWKFFGENIGYFWD